MKTTDEMIMDLHEKAGFVLPEGLGHDADGFFINVVDTWKVSGSAPAILIHDLCAMEFARQIRVKDDAGKLTRSDPSDSTIANMQDVLGVGDSASAIKALWEGVCYG